MWNQSESKFKLQLMCDKDEVFGLGANSTISSGYYAAAGSQWQIRIQKKCAGPELNPEEDSISLFLAPKLPTPKVTVHAVARLTGPGSGICVENNYEKSYLHTFDGTTFSWGWPSFVPVRVLRQRSKEQELLYDNSFLFEADVTVLTIDGVPIDGITNHQQPTVTFCEKKPRLASDSEPSNPFNGPEPDVVVVSKCGAEFACHTYILATNEVFKRVYMKPTEETEDPIPAMNIKSKLRRVVLQEMSADVLRSVLFHIYHGSLKFDVSVAGDVVHAAETHDLPLLRRACEDVLSNNLITENFIENLLMSELINSIIMKEACMKFWLGHGKEVMKLTEWRKFVTDAAKDSKNQTLIDTLIIGLFDQDQSCQNCNATKKVLETGKKRYIEHIIVLYSMLV